MLSSCEAHKAPYVCGTRPQRTVFEHPFYHVHTLFLQTTYDLQHLQNHPNALACSSEEFPLYAIVNHRHCTEQVSLEVHFATMELLQCPSKLYEWVRPRHIKSQVSLILSQRHNALCIFFNYYSSKKQNAHNLKNSVCSGTIKHKVTWQAWLHETCLTSKQQKVRERKVKRHTGDVTMAARALLPHAPWGTGCRKPEWTTAL
jgi:hypothetical protein